jgi:hypothetical protein
MDLPLVGLATFAGQPACPDWDKLDGADVAILGIPIDTALANAAYAVAVCGRNAGRNHIPGKRHLERRHAQIPLFRHTDPGQVKLRLLSGLIKAPLITENCCLPNRLGTHRVWPMSDSFLDKSCLSARHGWGRHAWPLKNDLLENKTK